MMAETICCKKVFEGLSANDAFGMLGDEKFYCLVYSPNFCGFSSPDKVPDVFEMRCFNENFELRWVKNAETVIISEHQTFRDFDMENAGSFYRRSSQYLLWGTARDIDGKSCLFDYRTGKIDLPFTAEDGKRIFLTFDEFFRPDSKHGNMIWQFERLTGLTPCT